MPTLDNQDPCHREEHSWIKSYLEGDCDWEVLLDEVGTDMARGVRITEQFMKEEYEGGIFEKDIPTANIITAIVKDSIERNGRIAKNLGLVEESE